MTKAPHHIGIIMDGNRRWARAKGLPTYKGHEEGAETLHRILLHCKKIGVKRLTVYAFSSENWRRTKREVQFMLKLMARYIREKQQELVENHVGVHIIGDSAQFATPLRRSLADLEAATMPGAEFTLNVALSYGGRDEILRGVRKLVLAGKKALKVTEEEFANYLDLAGQPDPELVIRTGGEMRLSNFLLWHVAYSELFFLPVLWPDFTPRVLDDTIADFHNRERRFGK